MPKAAAHRYAANLCSAARVVTLLDFRRAGCWLLSLPLAGRSLWLVQGEIWLRGASQAAGYWHQGTLLPLDEGDG